MEIKDIQGNMLIDALVTEQAVKVDELMKQHSVTLSWVSVTDEQLPLGAYIVHEGVRYSLLAPYDPEQSDEATYAYKPVFEHPIMRWQHIPFFFYTYSEGKVISKELDWSLTDNPANFMRAVCDAILNETGEDWSYEISADLPASASLSFSNTDIFSGLNTIAGVFKTEWWFDYASKIVYLSKASYGDAVTLEVGMNIGVPSKNQSKEGYYTRFYAFGSTRNIEQSYAGSNVNSIVNRRLTLNPEKYPNGYIDIRDGLTESEILVKTLMFDDIYPRSSLTISDVKVRLMWRLDDNSEKVQIGTDSEGNPVYDQYAIWYFKIPELSFSKDMLIEGKALSVHFNSGALNGREFELTYHDTAKEVTTSDGTSIQVEVGDYEINFIEEGTYIIPAITGLVPMEGDAVTLFNIVMPEEYKASAYEELEQEVRKEIAKQGEDRNNYTFDSNKVAFFESNPNLAVGRNVLYKNGSTTLATRVIRLETQLDYAFEQKITIGNEQIKGTTQTLKEEVVNANQSIDLLAAINENTEAFQQSLQRTQKAVLDSLAKWGDMWVLDPANGAVRTRYNLIVEGGGAFGQGAESGDVPSASVAIKFEGSDVLYNPINGVITLPAYPSAGGGVADSVAWSNVTGKPNFATVATSGKYSDLSGVPTSLPASDVYSWAKAATKPSYTKSEVGLGNVENTALSTWAGSSKITTLGTITSGVWNGTKIANAYLANSSVTISGTDVSLGGSITQAALRTALGLGSLAYKSSLVASDIPSLDWSKITSGKPTTLAGYGITDAISTSGGTIKGDLYLDYSLEKYSRIYFIDRRIGSGGYADEILVIRNGASVNQGAIGLYGNANGVSYYYFGHNAYNGNNLRIYSDKVSFGDSTLYHTGNFNPADYLPKSGGTITGQVYIVMDRPEIDFYKGSGNSVAIMGYRDGYGAWLYNDKSGSYLNVTDSGIGTFNGNTLIHSGNIGSYKAGDSDKLGGYGITTILPQILQSYRYIEADVDLNTLTWDNAGWWNSRDNTAYTNGPKKNFGLLSARLNTYYFGQLAFGYNSSELMYRSQYYSSSGTLWGPWKTIAFTDSNVASATKLQTARTIWGQSFDGSGNVDGAAIFTFNDGQKITIEQKAGGSNYCGISFFNSGFKVGSITASTLLLNPVYGGNVLVGTTSDNGAKLRVEGRSYIGNSSVWNHVIKSGVNSQSKDVYALKVIQGTDCGSGLYDTMIITSSDVATLRLSESDGTQIGICAGDGHGTFTSTHDFRFFTSVPNNTPVYGGGGGAFKVGINYEGAALYVSGNLTVSGGGAFGSDIRYKDILSYATLDLETIANAPLFTFKWNDREDKATHLGTSAQYWLETQAKDAVNITNPKFFHLDYGALAVGIGISVGREVKGVKTEVEQLRKELAQVKQELNYYKRLWQH